MFAGSVVMSVGCAVTSDPTVGGVVAEPVRVRSLTNQEGRKLRQLVLRGSPSSVRYEHADEALSPVVLIEYVLSDLKTVWLIDEAL
ncbi:hypothetical protein SBRY_50498 [Actinacidiphila bryophytorum]|uniref:Uncharacterized protein n=1 Tax=Actinacidiphila bryophytorum TaxID=1436133 RepID=A0A9W4MDG4_9ACTN|nr:hypothetical protein SBRY_50498 [Actinacidiphila bryophytorum]